MTGKIKDEIFLKFIGGMFVLLVLFGLGMAAALIWSSDPIGFRMVNAFASMFTGVLGLGSGYLLGRSG